MVAGFDLYQLRVDPNSIAATLHRALKDIAHAQLVADTFHVDGFTFESECCVAGDYTQAHDARQVRGQAFGYAIDEIFLFRIVTHIVEGQYDDRRTVCGNSGRTLDPCRRESCRGGSIGLADV